MKLVFQISILLILGGICLGQQTHRGPVEFFKEEITLTILDSTASVSGIYYFRNNTDNSTPFTIIFPFYVDSACSFPDKIRAFAADGDDTLDLDVSRRVAAENAVRLDIPMTPGNVAKWHLEYSQRIRTPHARYILTTTAGWGEPLEEATYKFVVPRDYRILSIWPRPDSTRMEGEFAIYRSAMKSFMPQRDMEISWQRR